MNLTRCELTLTRLGFFLLSAVLHGTALFFLGVKSEKTFEKNENRFEVDLVSSPKSIATGSGVLARSDSHPHQIDQSESKAVVRDTVEGSVGDFIKKSTNESSNESINKVRANRNRLVLSKEKLFPPIWSTIDPPPGKVSVGGKSEVLNARDQFNSMGLKEAAELLPFFRELSSKINNQLRYPKDFLLQEISGNVNLSIKIDSRGVWSGEIQSISAGNDYLKTYVLALLTQVLANPMENTLPEGVEFYFVSLSFGFKTHSFRGQNIDRPVRFLKNALIFNRDEFLEPKVNRKIEEVFTRYVPPVIPIPGGFYIDFYRAYQFIKNFGKPTESELRKQRIESWHRALKSTIHKEPSVLDN